VLAICQLGGGADRANRKGNWVKSKHLGFEGEKPKPWQRKDEWELTNTNC
jgi:hypothetical protein